MTLVRHTWEGGWWAVQEAAPHPRLRSAVIGPYVEWTERTAHPTVRRELAGTVVPLIINFDAPYRLHAAAHGPLTHRSFTAGIYDTFVDVHGATSAHAIQANLTPLAAHAVFGVPLGTLANSAVGLEDLLGGFGRSLVEQLGNATDFAMRARLLDAALLARLDAAPPVARAVRWSWEQLVAKHGQVSIADLQNATGWSATRLGTEMRSACGLTPRRLASLLRFEQTVRDARRAQAGGARWTWSRIAAQRGYADQAHLSREFQRFAGESPRAWAARLVTDASLGTSLS